MCEIFVMFSTDGSNLTKEHIQKFLECALTSAPHNRDGWGAFWERSDKHGFKKSPSEFTASDIPIILRDYRGSRFFAFHTRYATSKVCYSNAHPFTLQSFRGCHNGVVSSAQRGTDESDSLAMLQKIDLSPGLTLGEKILSSVPYINGTYSVLLHAFNENKLYYFRNTPSFTFMLDSANHLIYGATKIERLYDLSPLRHGFFPLITKRQPAEDTVYAIDLSNGNFSVVGEITPPKVVSQVSVSCSKEQTTFVTPLHKYNNIDDWRSRVYGGQRE